ncbi:conserved hypothetical protein [Bacillus subtilis]
MNQQLFIIVNRKIVCTMVKFMQFVDYSTFQTKLLIILRKFGDQLCPKWIEE